MKPTAPRKSDPNAREILGAELRSGMITYYRVVDGEGNVKFKQDHKLIEQIDVGMDGKTVGCQSGVHFKTERHNLVCYWTGGRVWVR